jgi:hypothetical protein
VRPEPKRPNAPDFTHCDANRATQRFLLIPQPPPPPSPPLGLKGGAMVGVNSSSSSGNADRTHGRSEQWFQIVETSSGNCLTTTLHTETEVCGVGSIYKQVWGDQNIGSNPKACLGVTLAPCNANVNAGTVVAPSGGTARDVLLQQLWAFESLTLEDVADDAPPDLESLLPATENHPMALPQAVVPMA